MVSLSSERYRGVLIGAGFFARFQAEAWKRLEVRLGADAGHGTEKAPAEGVPPFELTAVADLAPGRALEFAAHHGIPRAYESADAMLEAERPDFVDIATRPDTHLALTRCAAQRGMHVICQKPMAPTMAECVAMCEACEAAGVRLLIHENWRWQPWYRKAKRLIEAGELGSLRHLAFDWRTGDGNGPEPYAAQPYFRRMPRLLIYESLVHILDTFRMLAGELRVTACETRRVNSVIAGEDWAEMRCGFDSGATGFIHGDRHTGPVPAPVAMGAMLIEGERAALRIAPDGRMFLARQEEEEQVLPFTIPAEGYKGDSVLATQQHVLECLQRGQSCESEGRAYLKTVALVEQCYRLTNPNAA